MIGSKRAAVLMTAAVAMLMTLMGGAIAGAQSGTDDPAQLDAGQAVFESNCVGCHSADGSGSNTGRPLTDVASENDRERHVMSVTDGRGNMPPFGGSLEADEIDAAVTYVRLTFVSAQPEPELAVTGSTTTPLAIFGITLLATGAFIALLTRQRSIA
ncbi:MAG: c-type cytochrome [Acidimicrobiales bacterium]